MEYKHTFYSDYLIISLIGPFISVKEVDELYAFIQQQFIQNEDNRIVTKIVLDMDKVNYVSSMVIGFLIKVSDEIEKGEGKFALCNVNKAIIDVFKISRVELVLNIFDNTQKAIKYVSN
jgi:anti-anti-sigma factor